MAPVHCLYCRLAVLRGAPWSLLLLYQSHGDSNGDYLKEAIKYCSEVILDIQKKK